MSTPAKSDYATGRRKTATARVHLTPADADGAKIIINKREFNDYFPSPVVQMIVRQPLELTERVDKYNVKVTVRGGGLSGQAGAVRHGMARALQVAEPELRSTLKGAGLLTRDARMVERKKPGRHKARKSTQFSKR